MSDKFQWRDGDFEFMDEIEGEEDGTSADTPPAGAEAPGAKQTRAELDAWERKALARLKRGQSGPPPFETEWLPPSIADDVREDLEAATDADEVRQVFAAARTQLL